MSKCRKKLMSSDNGVVHCPHSDSDIDYNECKTCRDMFDHINDHHATALWNCHGECPSDAECRL